MDPNQARVSVTTEDEDTDDVPFAERLRRMNVRKRENYSPCDASISQTEVVDAPSMNEDVTMLKPPSSAAHVHKVSISMDQSEAVLRMDPNQARVSVTTEDEDTDDVPFAERLRRMNMRKRENYSSCDASISQTEAVDAPSMNECKRSQKAETLTTIAVFTPLRVNPSENAQKHKTLFASSSSWVCSNEMKMKLKISNDFNSDDGSISCTRPTGATNIQAVMQKKKKACATEKDKPQMYTCVYCLELCSKKAYLEYHMKTKHQSKYMKCEKCNVVLFSCKVMKEHCCYECPKCIEFYEAAEFAKHTNRCKANQNGTEKYNHEEASEVSIVESINEDDVAGEDSDRTDIVCGKGNKDTAEKYDERTDVM